MANPTRNVRRTSLGLIFGYLAIVYAFCLLAGCGVMSWGVWYSVSPYHRLQAEALLRGELALNHNPSQIDHDLCWSEGGVQQVWGLGVALWQTPLEALAERFGKAHFPDRIALGLFMALGVFFVLKTWFGPLLEGRSTQAFVERPEGNLDQWCVVLGAVIGILLFPPLIYLLRYRMWIYEEVMAYVYFFGILLMCGLLALARNPKWGRFWLLCAVAGIGGLVRPTLVFYGLATTALASLIMFCHKPGPSGCRPNLRLGLSFIRNPRLLLGLIFFLAGGGLLFLTNYLRFGSGWEFGHSLNVQGGDLLPSVYSTRFGYPFSNVSLMESARELFGALFCVNHFNGLNWYSSGIFSGQSPTIRWREFSFSTYSTAYAAGVGLAWAVGGTTAWRQLRACRGAEAKMGAFQPPFPYALVIVWSMLAFPLLAVFYLKVPAIASRYMLDFAPAFAAALVGLWHWIHEQLITRARCPKRAASYLLIGLLIWLSFEIFLTEGAVWPMQSITSEEMLAQETLARQAALAQAAEKKLRPNQYQIGDPMESWHIPYNGQGWNSTNGSTRLCAIFFVDSPECLNLELAAIPGSSSTETLLTKIRAKVGLEFLRCNSITPRDGGWMLSFSGPKQLRYKNGLQPVYLALVAPEDMSRYTFGPSPWILKRLTWRNE